MKALNTILKILAVVAAIAGIVYVVITYGDKILAWATRLLERCRLLVDRLACKWSGCTEELACDAATEADFATEE